MAKDIIEQSKKSEKKAPILEDINGYPSRFDYITGPGNKSI